MKDWKVGDRFAPRPVYFREVLDIAGFRFKIYEILYGSKPLDRPLYELALNLASQELPQNAITDKRPGVGFIICHQGRGWHYLVVCWWDNENELIFKVFVKEIAGNKNWRPADSSQSICVWDLEVIWFERNAYVETVLSGGKIEEYLMRRFNTE